MADAITPLPPMAFTPTPDASRPAPPPSDATPVAPQPMPVTANSAGTVVTGRQTVFGRNYDGSPDAGDSANSGFFKNPLTGGQYDSHDPNQAFASLPFSVFRAAIGNPYDDKIKNAVSNGAFKVAATVGGKTVTLPIGDLGPAAWTGNALDLSGGAAHQMGLKENGKASYQIIGPDNKPVQFKGDLGIDPNAPIDPNKNRSSYSADTIQRYTKFAQGLKVAMPEDVHRMDDYIAKGGHLYDFPFQDQLAYNMGKDPAFITKPENFPIFYDQVWKPNANKSIGDQISAVAQSAPGALLDVAKGAATYVGQTAQRMPEFGAYVLNNLTGKSDPGLEQAIGNNMATNAQAAAQGGVDAVDLIDAGITNVANIPRSLFSNLPNATPQARQAVDMNNARDSQALLARQYARSGFVTQAQQLASQAYSAIGMNSIAHATSSAEPSQSVVQGGAMLTNPLNVALEGVGEIAGGAIKPIFYERAINNVVAANKADALATALKSAVTKTPDMLDPVANQAAANLSPAVRQSAAVSDVAGQDAGRVWQALMQSPNEQGAASSILKGAVAPVSQKTSDVARSIGAFPQWLSGKMFPMNPSAQAAAATGISLAAEHVAPLGGVTMAAAKAASGPLENIATLAGLAGKELSYGEASLPFWQRMHQGIQGDGIGARVTRGVMQGLDNPAMYTASGMTKGIVPGAVAGGVLGALGSPMPNLQSTLSGAMQGGILGMMGGGFGQWQKYNSPGQTLMEAAGDYRRFKATLNTTESQAFNKLDPLNQGFLSQSAQHFPGTDISFIHDPGAPSGWHDPYAGSSGGSRVVINTASKTPLDGVIAHELLHSAAHSGNYSDIIDSLLGNQNKGTIGQYTLRDNTGKPILDAHGNYQTTPEFDALKQTYLNKIASVGEKVSSLTNRDIAGEIWAEHGVDYLKSGQGFVDAKSAYNPAVASNPNAMKNGLAKLGYGFKPGGSLVKGTGLFPELQKNNDVYGLMKSYMVEKRKYDLQHLEDRTDTIIRPEDIKQNPVILSRYGAVPEIARTKDGSPILDKNGNAIPNSKAVVEKTYKAMGDDIHAGLSSLSESERDAHGVYQVGPQTHYKTLPDSVIQSLSDSGKYNPEQIKNLAAINKSIADPSMAGQEFRMFYQAALKGQKYGSIAGADRNFVPYGGFVSKGQNMLIKAVDFGSLANSYVKLKNKPFMKQAGFSSVADFMQSADQYFRNHVDNMPGVTALDDNPSKAKDKRDAINASLDLDTAHWRESNPFTKQIPKRTGAFIKTLRLDRINTLTPTDTIRPFKSDAQYDMMNRNYLPGDNLPNGEKVKSPAVKINGNIYEGWSHGTASSIGMKGEGLSESDRFPFEDGFTTTSGKFVSRSDARELAIKSSQLKPEAWSGPLHSFDYSKP
jgi:hypothetical protein